jgi:hypothetical protein
MDSGCQPPGPEGLPGLLPTVGLLDDMTVVLPKSGVLPSPVSPIPQVLLPCCVAWAAGGLLGVGGGPYRPSCPTIPFFPQHNQGEVLGSMESEGLLSLSGTQAPRAGGCGKGGRQVAGSSQKHSSQCLHCRCVLS